MSGEREVVKYPLGSVTIAFPAEMKEEILVTLKAKDYFLALLDLDQFMRSVVKYGHSPVYLDGDPDAFDLDPKTVQYVRQRLGEAMEEHGVSLEDLS